MAASLLMASGYVCRWLYLWLHLRHLWLHLLSHLSLHLLLWRQAAKFPFDASDAPGRSNTAPGFFTTNQPKDTRNVSSRSTGSREAKRRQRVERLLSGELRLIKPASELTFDFDAASRIARRNNKKGG